MSFAPNVSHFIITFKSVSLTNVGISEGITISKDTQVVLVVDTSVACRKGRPGGVLFVSFCPICCSELKVATWLPFHIHSV